MIPWPEDRWHPPEIAVHITGGPDRIYDEDAAGSPVRFLGFAPTAAEPEPLLWEGDNA